MPKSDLELDRGDRSREYVPVAERITLFYGAFPSGRIITELLSPYDSPLVAVRAAVYRRQEDEVPAATGLAREHEADGEVNAVACLENAETSAIGRALANLGITGSRQRPSAEEMDKAARARARLRAVAPPPPAPPPAAPAPRRAPPDADDLLRLLTMAQALGARRARVESLRGRVVTGPLAPRALARLGRVLRRWLRAHDPARFGHINGANGANGATA